MADWGTWIRDWSFLADTLGGMGEDFWSKWSSPSANKDQGVLPYQRRPGVFFIFLVFFLTSNLFAFMMRIYKNSLPAVNITTVTILSSYIVELYNLIVVVEVTQRL